MNDDGDEFEIEPHTSVTMQVGQITVTIETSAGWTPEMIDDSLKRIRFHVVAATRQLGLVREVDTEG